MCRKKILFFVFCCLSWAAWSQELSGIPMTEQISELPQSSETSILPLPQPMPQQPMPTTFEDLMDSAYRSLGILETTSTSLYRRLQLSEQRSENYESLYRQSSEATDSLKLHLGQIVDRLQDANEDYAAEQEYHARQEAALKFKLKAVTISVGIAVPVIIVSTAYLTYRLTR